MELVDELVTPGCPNCVIKHLSAALAYMAEARCESFTRRVPRHAVMAARAQINLVESMQGYSSHFDFAVGLLVLAEELAISDSATRDGDASIAKMYRKIRLDLIQDGPAGLVNALGYIEDLPLVGSSTEPNNMMLEVFAFAHAEEAYREAPKGELADLSMYCVHMTVKDVQDTIARVRKEFFDFCEGEKPAGEKGDTDMATAKKAPAKAAKKAAPAKAAAKTVAPAKATKAACKGGKAKK